MSFFPIGNSAEALRIGAGSEVEVLVMFDGIRPADNPNILVSGVYMRGLVVGFNGNFAKITYISDNPIAECKIAQMSDNACVLPNYCKLISGGMDIKNIDDFVAWYVGQGCTIKLLDGDNWLQYPLSHRFIKLEVTDNQLILNEELKFDITDPDKFRTFIDNQKGVIPCF